ncbi:hypothetical protein [Lactococcus lactis]|uniref:RipA family octameric membrane protein n=1 Tax=Lactococcus lactis TaxID=1358 RepID=UPI0022E05BB6|nr:hypothetical protein [Lactococcus lactis]
MSEKSKLDRLIASRDKAFQNRTFEIELYWKRTAYFMTAVGAITAGIVAVLTKEGAKDTTYLMFFLSILLFIISLLWYMLNKGSKAWQERWESIVIAFEEDIRAEIGGEVNYPSGPVSVASDKAYLKAVIHQFPDNFYNLSETEKTPFKRYSVSKINLSLSFTFILISFFLIIGYGIKLFAELKTSLDNNVIAQNIIFYSLVSMVIGLILVVIFVIIRRKTLSSNFKK